MAKSRCSEVYGRLGIRCSLPPHGFHVEHAGIASTGLVVWGGTGEDLVVQGLCHEVRILMRKHVEQSLELARVKAELEAKRAG